MSHPCGIKAAPHLCDIAALSRSCGIHATGPAAPCSVTTTDGVTIRADGIAVDVDSVVAVDAKFTGNPLRSPYTGTAPGFMQGNVLAEFDSEIWRYGHVIDDPANPVGRLRIIANTPESLAFLTERARSVLGDGFDIVGVLQP